MSAKSLPAAPSTLFPLVLIAPFFLWGTAMVAMKGIMLHTTPLFVAGVRLVPAGCLVLGLTAILKLEQPKTWRAWAWIALFALLDGLLFQGFLAEGLLRTGAGLGSVMIDSQPIVIALLSSWLFGELIGLWGWLGLGVGVLGITLIGVPADGWAVLLRSDAIAFQWSALFNNGQWLMFLASLSMALGTVSIRYVSRHVDPVVATGWHMILGGVPLFVMSGLWETEQWAALTGSDWGALAYATVFGSAIAYALFFWIASSGNLTSFTSLTFLTPVFALVFSHLLLTEVLNPVQWWGVVLTLVSITLINQRDGLAQWTATKFAPPRSEQPSQVPAKVEGDSP
ncbi:EamA family transporter [Spirulina major CS-329]|uniref:DMT family transporter n=1 Tax=Spirulina TaxID=1154 RepID=UPI00232E2D4D|nr:MULTISPECIES: EamA family transporter [Spirulina]MDB9495809.1 EamA family transporter [Spirulina subsalsa CS-330]MDB9503753.1 EamA family transporter [Spirulina major CS-329]